MSTPPKPIVLQTPSNTRDWWGVRQVSNRVPVTSDLTVKKADHVKCTQRLLDDPSAATSLPADTVIPSEKLQALQALAIERILSAGGADMGIRRKVLGEQSIVR